LIEVMIAINTNNVKKFDLNLQAAFVAMSSDNDGVAFNISKARWTITRATFNAAPLANAGKQDRFCLLPVETCWISAKCR
jgi:hypothetical protein